MRIDIFFLPFVCDPSTDTPGSGNLISTLDVFRGRRSTILESREMLEMVECFSTDISLRDLSNPLQLQLAYRKPPMR